ncbi:MAG: hypothetical protein QOE97_2326 [Pseudonocardiales bacterium]|jgi:hypothetical protein|nr:hypothetical protein [Pseudonocardiales bacterium]
MEQPRDGVEKAEVLSADETAQLLRRGAASPAPPATHTSAVGILAGLARIAAESSVKAAAWGLTTGAAGTRAVVGRALRGEPPAAVLQDLAADLRSAAWRALGVPDDPDEHGVPESVAPINATTEDLRYRGEELLRRSNDVHVTEDTHPAFARILTEITPDEARILRYLYLNGPQPSLDVRTNRPFGVGSQLVAGGLNMIAEHAGCRNVERIHPYLTNLNRLGLIDFSKEQVSNPQRYQLVEAQPCVVEALKRAGRLARIVHRSIQLNDFGADFCRACLPVRGASPS